MKYLDLETISDFVCTGSDCPFTCCGGGWEIRIDEKTYDYYRSVTGKMKERFDNSIVREDDKIIFKLTEDLNCPFLNDKGLCDIYINLGEEHLCFTCTYYPRYSFRSGDICFSGVSISCPEVSKFFLTHKDPLMIDFAEDNAHSPEEGTVDWNLFNQTVRVFTNAVSIAQNRDLYINERLALILIFVNRFQECLDNGNSPEVTIRLFSDPSGYINLLPQTGIYNRDFGSKVKFASEVLNYFKQLAALERRFPELCSIIEHFNSPGCSPVDPEHWAESYQWTNDRNNDFWQENILVYSLFRYFMDNSSGYGFYKKLTTGVILVLCVTDSILSLYRLQNGTDAPLDYKIMLISHLSRLVEHGSATREHAYNHFFSNGICDMSFLLKLIS